MQAAAGGQCVLQVGSRNALCGTFALYEGIMGGPIRPQHQGEASHALAPNNADLRLTSIASSYRYDRSQALFDEVHRPNAPVGHLQALPQLQPHGLQARRQQVTVGSPQGCQQPVCGHIRRICTQRVCLRFAGTNVRLQAQMYVSAPIVTIGKCVRLRT